MSGQKKRGFHMTPEQEEFVGGAKVHGTAAQHDTAQHSAELLPWEDLSCGASSINFKFTAELNAKAIWSNAVKPGGISKLAFLRRGAELAFEEIRALHYKPKE